MFAELLRRPGVREVVSLRSSVGFLALHGGLEPGTERVAEAAARAADASAYVVVQPREQAWHLSSHRIDPAHAELLARFLDHVEVVISVHGYWRPELEDAVFVGGGNRPLAGAIAEQLRTTVTELPVVDDLTAIPPGMRGIHPRNPVNGSRGGGVQLELPHRARTGARIDDAPPLAERITRTLATWAAEYPERC